MKMLNGFRAASILFFYYIVLMIFPVLLPLESMILTVLFLSLCCAAAACWEENALRYLCALLPPAVLLFQHDVRGWAAAAVPIFIAELMILTPMIRTTVWRFGNFCRFLIPLILFGTLIGAERNGKDIIILVLGLLDFTSAVFTLRQLRMGSSAGLRDRGYDLAAILSVPFLAAVVTAALRAGMKLIGILVTAFVSLIAMVMRQIVEIFTDIPFTRFLNSDAETTKATEETLEEILETVSLDTQTDHWVELNVPVGFYYFLGGLVLLALLLYFGRGFFRFVNQGTASEDDEEWLTEEETISVRLDTPRQQESNRRQIRKIYSRFLRMSEEKGYYVRRTDTSQDVLEGVSGQYDEQSAQALRQIYIIARYHSERRITSQDVAEAKRLLRKLKEDRESPPSDFK